MSSTPTPVTSIPQLTSRDLSDPTLFRLNYIIQMLGGQIAAIYTPGQMTSLGATLTVPNIVASQQSTPPTNQNTLITLQTAQALFGAATQRQALTTGNAPGLPQKIQPLPNSSSNITLVAGSGISIMTSGSSFTISTTGAGVPNFADDETPTGTINGTNATFTLAHSPSPAGSLLLFLNGVLQLFGTDITLSGGTITYATAPSNTSWHRAYYRY